MVITMSSSHADTHDLDKLARWYSGLSGNEVGQFPVHAMFLVSSDDRAAHDIFRQFRFSFETHAAQFHHLVIFGQHGISSTVRKLLGELGLPAGSLPVLVLFDRPSNKTLYAVPLPSGGGTGYDGGWIGVLARVEESTSKGDASLGTWGLEAIPSPEGLVGSQPGDKALLEMVRGVLKSLS